MVLSFRSPWYSPLPPVLRKIFELKTLGSDLGENKAGLNVAVRLAPDWLVAGLIIEGVSRVRLLLEGLSDHLFTFLPECLGVLWIERVAAYSFGGDAEGHVVGNDLADVAVLAVAGSDLVRG